MADFPFLRIWLCRGGGGCEGVVQALRLESPFSFEALVGNIELHYRVDSGGMGTGYEEG